MVLSIVLFLQRRALYFPLLSCEIVGGRCQYMAMGDGVEGKVGKTSAPFEVFLSLKGYFEVAFYRQGHM